jgi:hypothetical protein
MKFKRNDEINDRDVMEYVGKLIDTQRVLVRRPKKEEWER